MPTETIISLVVAVAALLFTAASFKRTKFQDNTTNATERANMTADIRYIRSSVDDIKLENKSIQQDIRHMSERLVVVEQSRIDEIINQKG